MKELKQHLNRARFSNTNYDENSMQPESNLTATNKEVKKESVTKLEFVPGVIVNVKLPEPCHDAKKTKVSRKTYNIAHQMFCIVSNIFTIKYTIIN